MQSPLLRLRTSAYVFFEDPGSASIVARLAAAELPVALLWGFSLLGFVVLLLVVPYVPLFTAALLVLAEALLALSAIVLSGVWIRGHKTPVLTAEALILEGALHSPQIPVSEMARVAIRTIGVTDPPLSRLAVILRNGKSVHLDLGRDDALTLCRALQRRLFGGALGVPYDAALKTLDRARMPIDTWVAGLRERFAKSGYRYAAGIAEDELDRALHDAALPAARRVGAALAMCAAGGPPGRERILQIAERLETTALRVAVERAADGALDEETLARAEAEDAALGRTG